MSAPTIPAAPPIDARRGLWGRQLDRYPGNGARALYLGIIVVSTVTLYYELFVQNAVSTQIAANLHMSLAYFIAVIVTGYGLGAVGSVVAGLADRWGRANLVVYGLALTGGLVLFGLPNAHTKLTYLVLFGLVSIVEGVVLVASPALVRDFSPQVGRASAMGLWTLGPVVGSLLVTEVSSNTLTSHPDWQYQFRFCGVVGLGVFVIAFVGLRELAPRLRDQLMVSLRDQAVVEARARGVDPDRAVDGRWRQVLRTDVIGPAFGIGAFLLFFYMAVGLFVVFYTTTFGYSLARANALGNWYWGLQAVALVIAGVVSDRLRVRKPFMVVGAAVSAVGVALFALATTHADTGYYHFAWIIALISVGSAIALSAWMAAFTETVEKHSPAATATGLAIWGAMLRVIVVATLGSVTFAIPAAETLVDHGPQVEAAVAGKDPNLSASQNAIVKAVAADPGIAARAQQLAARDSAEVATAARLSPSVSTALIAHPDDQKAQAAALSQISGKPVGEIARVMTLSTRYRAQLATAATLDPATQTALATGATDPATLAKAVGEIAAGLHVPVATATADLQALAEVPPADLVLLRTDGPAVQQARAKLTALAAVPPADLTFLNTYGRGLKDPAVASALASLQKEAPAVRKATEDGPEQWQRWWWLCFIGQLVFLPSIWLLAGRWSPAKARADAAAHNSAVARELAALAAERAEGRQAG
ncbi:MFS transporter [Actinacidiphila sp. DG2A-62]|uniref:MFS transporter n=1 Tax=Actinacidiphila sp. DG2A-62 TaxID=3108821 RepID=UPI002DC04ED4|nr:MFS transporter [Actinacidiphila sp. DG2A-62]MEC3993220.1 MFS transporter [Actinacidiphila sp. DG2A-62]